MHEVHQVACTNTLRSLKGFSSELSVALRASGTLPHNVEFDCEPDISEFGVEIPVTHPATHPATPDSPSIRVSCVVVVVAKLKRPRHAVTVDASPTRGA